MFVSYSLTCAGVSLRHRPADEMEAFLPSEIGRLIYGYLFQQCGEGLANEFLNTSDSMQECRLLKQKYAKNFHHKVQDLSLEDILNQYSVLCALIFKQASTEEPVHRNVLGLLKKVLSSRLLGLSGSSANRSCVAKPTGNKEDNSVDGETVASKSGTTIAQSKQPANPVDVEVNSSVSIKTGVSKIGTSDDKFEQRANPTDEDNVAFSPGVSDAGDCHMDVDVNDSSSEEMLEEDSLSNAAKESAPVEAFTEHPKKNISPNVESRICAILCNSASLVEHARHPIGPGNLPFPAEYCTPRKQNVATVSSALTLPVTNLPKSPICVPSTVVDTPTAVMKSIENVCKSSSLVAGSGPATPKSGEYLSKKPGDKVSKREKVLHQGTSRTSSKTITKSSSIAPTSTSTVDSVSPVISFPAAKLNDQVVVPTPSTNASEVSPATVLVNLSKTPVLAVSSAHQESRVSAIPSPMTNVEGVPTVASASAIIPEETESIFGELSFESECHLPSKLDRSSSSVKSDSEVVGKLRRSPIKRSPRKATVSPVDSAVSTISEVTTVPIQNSTARKAETTRKSAADLVVLPDSTDTVSTGSKNEDIAWDLKLRLFVDDDSPMDAHITKRKPKDPKTKKPKEVSKKRKHNDDLDNPSSTTKRLKSEVAAVPVGTVIPCPPPPVSKSLDVDRSVNLAPSPLRKRRGGFKEEVEGTLQPMEKKSDRNRRGKGAHEGKITPEASNRVKVDQESKKTAEAANVTRSSTSMNVMDFDSPKAEKKKSERLEKAVITEKKKQQVAHAKIASSKELREAVKAQRITKPAAPVAEKAINLIGSAKGRKRSERIEELVAAQKKSKDDVDSKSATFKEPNLPQIKEKPSSSPRETNKSHRKEARSEANDKVDEANEILEDHHQLSVVAVRGTPIGDPVLDDEESEFEMVLEISPEFVLFHRSPK